MLNVEWVLKMQDDPIEDIYTYVEQAYIRLHTGDVLIRCLEEKSVAPIQHLVEGLILAGPQSLDDLRQVLAETRTRRLQVEDDLRRVYTDMKEVLNEYGVQFPKGGDFREALTFTPLELILLMSKQSVNDNDRQSSCLRVFEDSQELMNNLNVHFNLLSEIEIYIQDWLWGLTYQFTRQRRPYSTRVEL